MPPGAGLTIMINLAERQAQIRSQHAERFLNRALLAEQDGRDDAAAVLFAAAVDMERRTS